MHPAGLEVSAAGGALANAYPTDELTLEVLHALHDAQALSLSESCPADAFDDDCETFYMALACFTARIFDNSGQAIDPDSLRSRLLDDLAMRNTIQWHDGMQALARAIQAEEAVASLIVAGEKLRFSPDNLGPIRATLTALAQVTPATTLMYIAPCALRSVRASYKKSDSHMTRTAALAAIPDRISYFDTRCRKDTWEFATPERPSERSAASVLLFDVLLCASDSLDRSVSDLWRQHLGVDSAKPGDPQPQESPSFQCPACASRSTQAIQAIGRIEIRCKSKGCGVTTGFHQLARDLERSA
jgi:hypothetical protein